MLHAGGLYWVGSLALLGGLDLLRDLLPWLDRAFPALVLTAILLFPVVLILSWAFDLTPSGLRLYRPGQSESLGLRQRLTVILVLAVATSGFGWAVLLLWSNSEDGRADRMADVAGGADPTDIAVLYFDDYSPDGALGYLANGLTEELITALGSVEGLTVTSRNGVRPFQDTTVPGDSIAERLGVGTLVTGSITGQEGRVRVFAQLVDVTGRDEQLWSGQFEHAEADILTLQSELVREISASLRRNLGVVVRSREAAEGATDDQAWLLYQEAKALMDRALLPDAPDIEYSLGLLDQADRLLADAAARDPAWAAPLVDAGWLAFGRSRLTSPVAGFVQPSDSAELLRRADEAVARSDSSAAALELRGVVRFELAEAGGMDGPVRASAESDLMAAIRKDPERARALAYLGSARRFAGDFLEARHYARRALEADAFLEDAAGVIYGLYVANLELKAWEAADRWCKEGRRRFQESLRFVFCRMQFEALRPVVPSPDVAWALLDTLRAESTAEDWDFQNRTWGGYHVARILARNALPDSAEAVLRRSWPAPSDRPWFAYDEAHVQLVMGHREKALELLALYLRVAPDRRSYLPSDWLFEELWDDPRFQELTSAAGGS